MEEHLRTHNDDHAVADTSAVAVADSSYQKPVLIALGRWNLFTRAPSENPDEGFFEFDFGG